MDETSKAMRRRFIQDFTGEFPWMKIFSGQGAGIDVGCGPDLISIAGFIGFDEPDGDANHLSRYFPPESFDVLHSSQCLEHLHDPVAALKDWLTLVKLGGWAVVSFPAMELYGDMLWDRSRMFNGDHKATFSLWMRGSPAPVHIYIPDLVTDLEANCGVSVMRAELCDTNYDYKIGFSRDQTYEGEVEAFIELAIYKDSRINVDKKSKKG